MAPETETVPFGIQLPPGDLILALTLAQILGMKPESLARRGPQGRTLIGSRAYYPRSAVLRYLREREAAGRAALASARARAAHARAVRERRRQQHRESCSQ